MESAGFCSYARDEERQTAFCLIKKIKNKMEKFVTIINQGAHVAHQYTAQDGTQKVYHTMGFVLSDGIGRILCRDDG